MIAASTLELSDLSRQKRMRVNLRDELTPEHSVGQAVEVFLDHMDIPEHGLPWKAFSRGKLLDRKTKLADVPDVDTSWTVMPEVSAGAGPASA